MSLKQVIDQIREKSQPKPENPDEGVEDLGEAVWNFLRQRGQTKDESRAPGYHPSQMFRFCPRREILSYYFPKPEYEYSPPESELVFDWGSAWHWWAQNHYFGPMGLLFGTWKCTGCGKLSRESFMPEPCPDCFKGKKAKFKRGGFWTYKEPSVFSKEWQMPGHGDGILILSRKMDGKRSLLEIKTINGEEFRKLSGPKEEHVFQVNIYMWLMGLEECWLTYWSKDSRPTKPKVFRVPFDPEIPKEVQRRISLHRRAWPGRRLCEGVCKGCGDRMSKRCNWSTECFRDDIEIVVEKMRGKNAPSGS